MGTVHRVGYARVSTLDQKPELQLDALRAAGCKKIFVEKVSSSKEVRPQLEAALEHLRPGDTLVVWKLDRFARSMKQLLETVDTLKGRGVAFQSPCDRGTRSGICSPARHASPMPKGAWEASDRLCKRRGALPATGRSRRASPIALPGPIAWGRLNPRTLWRSVTHEAASTLEADGSRRGHLRFTPGKVGTDPTVATPSQPVILARQMAEYERPRRRP